MVIKRLDSGYWYIASVGVCNYAQPPHWPCDEATLRAHMNPDASHEFVRDAMAYSEAATLRADVERLRKLLLDVSDRLRTLAFMAHDRHGDIAAQTIAGGWADRIDRTLKGGE